MGKYAQTLARIGFGFAALAAMATWLWPSDPSKFLEDPFALFALATAIVVWIAAEYKLSEEVQFRGSSPNDIRLARMLLQYHAEQFRILLKEHDFHNTIQPRYVSEASFFLHEFETRHLNFQNKELAASFIKFCDVLRDFSSKVAQYTVPYQFPGGYRTSVRGPHDMNDFDISENHKREIRELNELGFKAWDALETLITSTKKSIPEALDEPLKVEWLAPDYDRKRSWDRE